MKKLIVIIFAIVISSCSKDGSTSSGDDTGKNGSIARFAIKGDYMYTIDVNYVRIFSLVGHQEPQLVQSVKVAYGLETIFIYGDNIYLGAIDGVYILNINDPSHPHQTQKIEHHISCDPVVVQGNFAYSTQRVNATGCGTIWHMSALAVYDVSDPNNPALSKEISMNSPFGLAVEGNWLFVCDGGILVYDVTDPANPVEAAFTVCPEARDIITMYPYMVVSTKTEFKIFNYADPLYMYELGSLTLN